MGKYTIINDDRLDVSIEKDILLCRDSILKRFGEDVLSIALIGGYGRGEGGAIAKNGEMAPVNNYDLFIVFRGGLFPWQNRTKSALRSLKAELDEELMTVFEASFRSEKALRLAPPIMIYHDIYNAGKTIFGREIKDLLPPGVKGPLPAIEAVRVLRNRSMLLLFGLDGVLPAGYDATPDQMKTWYSKAVIGFGDAMAIIKGSYRTGYCDKMNVIQDMSIEDVFGDKESARTFKALHKAASLYRLKNEDSPVLEEGKRDSRLLGQVNLWVLRTYLGDPCLEWEDILRTCFSSRRPAAEKIRNIFDNLPECISAGSFSMLLRHPMRVFDHPSDKLSKVLPLLLYKPMEGYLDKCAIELGFSGQVREEDILKECFRIFEKYIA